MQKSGANQSFNLPEMTKPDHRIPDTVPTKVAITSSGPYTRAHDLLATFTLIFTYNQYVMLLSRHLYCDLASVEGQGVAIVCIE